MSNFSETIQSATIGVRYSSTYFARQRKISDDNMRMVADLFGHADEESIRGSKTLLGKDVPEVKAVYSILGLAKKTYEAFSMPYPEKGLRIMRLDRVNRLTDKLDEIKVDLEAAVNDLREAWDDVKEEAKGRLKHLYNEDDYVAPNGGSFKFEVTFPTIEVDKRLATLHPEIYEAERRRLSNMVDAAVMKAEEEVISEMSDRLVDIVDKLNGKTGSTGKPLYVTQHNLDKIKEVAEEFKNVTLGNTSGLDSIVEEIEALANNTDRDRLKVSGVAKAKMKESITDIMSRLGGVVVERPGRKISLED